MRWIPLVAVLLLVLAGCSTPRAAPTEPVVAPDVTLEPGETKSVTVEARNVTSVRVATVTGPVSFDYANVTTDPPNDLTLQSYPPIWMWEERRDAVTVTLPVTARANATAGEYEYSVDTSGGELGENVTSETGIVTVVARD